MGPGPGAIPFYSPCCHDAPGRHFPCKHLNGPPKFYGDARADRPPFCPAAGMTPRVTALPVPADYPDISPNPRSRQFHEVVDEFRSGFKRSAGGKKP